ncbi:MAG: hypothetical protein WCO35_02110 [Candidatus Nomurabacteria bacterium]
MSNFITNYLNRMRKSDESTRHRSALTISIILSVIILSIAFVLLKDNLFNFSNYGSQQDSTTTRNNSNGVVSPLASFSQFFKDTGSQFSEMKNNISEVVSVVKNKAPENSTSTQDIYTTASFSISNREYSTSSVK